MMIENNWAKVKAQAPSPSVKKYPLSTSEKGIYEAMILFFKEFFPGLLVIKGQVNRVSLPKTGPFVLMQIIDRKRISTEETVYTDTHKFINQHMTLQLYLDFWGSQSCTAFDLSAQFETIWNNECTFELFKSLKGAVRPLYTDGSRNAPLVDSEKQYADRYVQYVYLDYFPQVALKQESATEIIMSVGLAD